jgi:hypothetical protein
VAGAHLRTGATLRTGTHLRAEVFIAEILAVHPSFVTLAHRLTLVPICHFSVFNGFAHFLTVLANALTARAAIGVLPAARVIFRSSEERSG